MPFCKVIFIGMSGEKLPSMFAKWLPVSWSCHWPTRNTGASMSCTKVAGATASVTAPRRNRLARISFEMSAACSRSCWLSRQVVSPSAMRFAAHCCPPPPTVAGSASSCRSFAQPSANPLLKMPPG